MRFAGDVYLSIKTLMAARLTIDEPVLLGKPDDVLDTARPRLGTRFAELPDFANQGALRLSIGAIVLEVEEIPIVIQSVHIVV